MNQQDVAYAYRASTIENAPPIKILRLLYAGALRFVDRAVAEDASDPRSEFVGLVERAYHIVSELRLSIVHEHNPDVGQRLDQLYTFVEDRLVAAMMDRQAAPLQEARLVMERLQDAWNRVEQDQAGEAR